MRLPIAALALAVWVLAPPAAWAQLRALPSCSGLIPDLQRDVGLVRSGLVVEAVDEIVEDLDSSPNARQCTGVAHYKDGTMHLTFAAQWRDVANTSYVIEAHETTDVEEASRALSLRVRTHPRDADGTFSLRTYVPYCSDAAFIKLATNELHIGISARRAFYKEPTFNITSMNVNGYGSGILANCVATLSDGKEQGAIFLGTDWVTGEANRRYQFYILDAGPDGWKLVNRLWQLGAE